MNSLLYSKYCVLNEINNLKINGFSISVEVKQLIYRDLFCASARKLTKKKILEFLIERGLAKREDDISGIDNNVKSSLKSYHDFRMILTRTKDEEMVEDIIQHILVFGEDHQMLRRWLDRTYPILTADDKKYICRLRYKDWGRLSREFLTGIFTAGQYGEEKSIMDCLWETNDNLMQLLSERYTFMRQIKENYHTSKDIHEQLDDMYISPAVRRSVWQALKIVDELVDIEKSAPKKIFVEVARESRDKVKKERTESRKSKLINLYKACGEETSELFGRLNNEEENSLRRDKLYLYYAQFGKCMYSGEPITDISAMLADNTIYEIDHIFPRSRIRDDSLDNRVLVKTILNRNKSNEYPLSQNIRTRMRPFWNMLLEKGLISRKKYERLIRNTELTEEELSAFVSRQLVSTQQSTKAVTVLLQQLYPNTKVVFSKAGNVSEFRHKFGIVKCREVNDFHHAKDAYLNIVVGNVYDTKFTEKFFKNIKRENYSLNKVFEYDVPGAWKKDGISIDTVRKYMMKNNIKVTRKPIEERGELFDLQLMPAGQGQLSVKNGRDINRYGGYNKIKGAYYFVVEHTEKKRKNRMRSIEPVYINARKQYQRDPVGYCKEILGLIDPRIIVGKINKDALFEIEGVRLMISGRSDERYEFKHAHQLVLDSKREQYINDMVKYIDRCASVKDPLPVTEFDHISCEDNIELYQWFCSKLVIPQYKDILHSVYDFLVLEETREKFAKMSILDQCGILCNVLKAFKCDIQKPNFSALGGSGRAGQIRKNKRIDQLKSIWLVNQSVTGLYETRINLLD